MMDLNLYNAFCAVVEKASVSRAADALFISQQAISYNIKQLETELGSPLFTRTPRGMTPTPEGRRLYATVKEALNTISAGEKIFKSDKELNSGVINIGCNTSLFQTVLQKHIIAFREKFPNIRFNIFGNSAVELLKMLSAHILDIVCTVLNDETAELPFEKNVFAQINFAFVAKDKDMRAPLLLLNRDSHVRKSLGSVSAQMDFTHYEPIISLVRAGAGVGYVIRELVERELKAGDLVEIPAAAFGVKNPPQKSDVAVLYDKAYLSFAAKEFCDTIRYASAARVCKC
jgi:DNA-binding transcriptional LysR family regulator